MILSTTCKRKELHERRQGLSVVLHQACICGAWHRESQHEDCRRYTSTTSGGAPYFPAHHLEPAYALPALARHVCNRSVPTISCSVIAQHLRILQSVTPDLYLALGTRG